MRYLLNPNGFYSGTRGSGFGIRGPTTIEPPFDLVEVLA
jgi:hypothetical protein